MALAPSERATVEKGFASQRGLLTCGLWIAACRTL